LLQAGYRAPPSAEVHTLFHSSSSKRVRSNGQIFSTTLPAFMGKDMPDQCKALNVKAFYFISENK
jgi:hypothetical protein